MIPDPNDVIAIMREVAGAVVLPRFGCLTAEDVRSKKHARDLVTVADVEAEHLLSARLGALIAGSAIVGEEAVAADPAVLGAIGRPGPVWIVDPVDGTCNFVDGIPVFALIVALVVDGETQGGWIYHPTSDQAVWALAGGGAFCTSGRGQERLWVGSSRPIGEMVGSLTVSMTKRLARGIQATGGRATPRAVRFGSAGCEYMDLVRGAIDYAVYSWLRPWDHAAGVLIHAEAGGYGRLVLEQPEPYRPTAPASETLLLLAPDEAGWQDLARMLAADSGAAGKAACS